MDDLKEFRQFLRNLLMTSRDYSLLFCGSFSELPIQYVLENATDIDILYISTHTCAIPVGVSAPHQFHGKTFVINTKDTYPGFARLYSSDLKQPYCWEASIFIDQNKHGPAWTKLLINKTLYTDIFEFVWEGIGTSASDFVPRQISQMSLDSVPAINNPFWPLEATEWKRRKRPYGWPPVEIIDKIAGLGCHLVAKPHQSSPNDDTQWRFSFSQAELILIHSWTDVQKYIYHILRLIKSQVVNACGGPDGTILCTYFFKTLMLWECERKSKEFWNDQNVEKSVKELLCIMIGWLNDGCCLNYFIPKCNMISVSRERVYLTQEIQLLLDYALSDITKTRYG